MIEELRAKQKQDERRKNLEELEKKKHIHDFEEKAAKNVNKNLNYLTYDMYGRMVDVQNLKNLPLLSRKCNSSLVNPVGEKGKKAKAVMLQKNINKKPKLWETEFYHSIPPNYSGNQMMRTFQRIYDNIIPEEGVTIIENGRNLKTNRGEFSKNDIDNILPDIGKYFIIHRIKTNNSSSESIK